MAYNELLADRVRAALGHVQRVQEKRMFGGIAFMVNGKMCITVGDNRLMCRIDPDLHEAAIKRKAVRPVRMRGKEYKGYVYVHEDGIKSDRDFSCWVDLCLGFNRRIKAPQKSKGK
ncbi:MAG TPA: TfoX/Sxy family protein [Candidatus Acidoferrales bacterium]|nr:TfoX/Sxy family protein [Candidatus Acidoferrales bacterium]